MTIPSLTAPCPSERDAPREVRMILVKPKRGDPDRTYGVYLACGHINEQARLSPDDVSAWEAFKEKSRVTQSTRSVGGDRQKRRNRGKRS